MSIARPRAAPGPRLASPGPARPAGAPAGLRPCPRRCPAGCPGPRCPAPAPCPARLPAGLRFPGRRRRGAGPRLPAPRGVCRRLWGCLGSARAEPPARAEPCRGARGRCAEAPGRLPRRSSKVLQRSRRAPVTAALLCLPSVCELPPRACCVPVPGCSRLGFVQNLTPCCLCRAPRSTCRCRGTDRQTDRRTDVLPQVQLRHFREKLLPGRKLLPPGWDELPRSEAVRAQSQP